MKFFKKGIEYNKLAKGFNGTFVMINELEVNIENNYSTDYSEFEQDILVLAYLSRKEILDRMEEYNWAMASPIVVPMMSKGRLTLTFAFQQTIGRLYKFAEIMGVSEEVNEILDKGNAYYEIDRAIPNHIKNTLS
ncbi:MAG: hypothetical protein PSN34_03780 [Urechidicola sp.]|nr:hypothetical protein [Urechidicola sp.]